MLVTSLDEQWELCTQRETLLQRYKMESDIGYPTPSSVLHTHTGMHIYHIHTHYTYTHTHTPYIHISNLKRRKKPYKIPDGIG